MRRAVGKQWFLLLVAGGIVCVAVWPGAVRWAARLDASLCGAVVIFLSAVGLEARRLVAAAARPRAATLGVALSYGLVPSLAWGVGLLFTRSDYQIGLMLVASVPCTLASAVIWTRLAGGDDATALLITLLTNGTGWLATTAWLTATTGIGSDGAPGMMLRLVLVLVVPVVLGQLVRLVGPVRRAADRHKTTTSVVARMLILAVMLKAGLEVRDRIADGAGTALAELPAVAAACVGVHLVGLFVGLAGGRLLRIDRPQRIAAAVSGSQKTLPVSLVLFDAYFTAYPLAVVPLVFYHFGQLLADTLVANVLVRHRPVPHHVGATPSTG
jgi:sodium/bile acid cotransporter 7